jgi:HD-like signal output (HDOD) protein
VSIHRDHLESMLDRIEELAVLPHVVFALMEPAGPAEPTAQEIERIICIDPGFTVKMLVLANSSSFKSDESIVSIEQAIDVLGYRVLRTLAMTAGTFEMFVGKNDPYSLRRRRWWRKAVDTAETSFWLAKRAGTANSSEAYSCGLLHLTGKFLLDRYGGGDYSVVT